jgi:hypothetical protein
MSKFLKGNYPVKNPKAGEPDAPESKNITKMFEEKALEKLGGSIAYVMKSNSFLWDEEEGK